MSPLPEVSAAAISERPIGTKNTFTLTFFGSFFCFASFALRSSSNWRTKSYVAPRWTPLFTK